MPDTGKMIQAGNSSELVDCGVIPQTAPSQEWKMLAVLVSVQFIHIMDFTMMMSLAPQFIRLFDLAPQHFGLLITAYTFSAGIFGFFAAFVIDHFDRKISLVVVCGGFSLAVLLCASSSGYQALLVARVVAGAFGGVMSAIVFSIIADFIPVHRRGSATGTILSTFPLVSILGVPAGLFLAEWFDWRAPYILLAVLGLSIIVAILRILPPVRAHLLHYQEKNPFRQLKVIFSNRNHLVAFLLIAMLMFAGFTVIPFISAYVVSNCGMREADLPYLYFFGGLSAFFSARLIGHFADRHGKRRVFGAVAIMSIIPIVLITNMSETSLFLVLVVTSLFMVLVTGRFVPAMVLITTSVASPLRGSFMSFNTAVQQISAGIASLLSGAIIGVSATGQMVHFELVGLIAVVSTIVCIFLAMGLKSVDETT